MKPPPLFTNVVRAPWALEASGVARRRVVHVGNDPATDIIGAAEVGIDTVLVDRRGNVFAPEATFVIRDLSELPDVVRG